MQNEKPEQFYRQLKEKRISFLGLGRSHRQLLEQFAAKGALVTLRDKRSREAVGEAECAHLEALGVALILGEDYLKDLDAAQMILRTPGFPYLSPELQHARENGAAVTSELELFFRLCPCKTYAVTGSDGKTTTTSVIAELLHTEGKKVFLGGNIGFPLLPKIEEIAPEDVAVIELSSFQLISMHQSPDVAVITNVTPNHLDVHKDMAEYINAKRNIYLHQDGLSRTVLGEDNEITAAFLPEVRGDAFTFSRHQPVRRGAFLGEDNMIYMADEKGIARVLRRDQIRIPGAHNVENYLAAISAVWGEVSLETIVKVAETFPGVEHRIEFVRELDGVRWFNDSIASSPTRTIAGLDAFPQKIILIAGGYDKKIPFLPLAPKIIEKVRVLLLMGATADKIEDTVKSFAGYSKNQLTILRVASMEEAVERARQEAVPGDIISLSPACASFDLYQDFEARGNHFKNLVNGL